MKKFPEQSDEFKKHIERETAKEVIKRYLAILTMGDDAKKSISKIRISNSEKLYNALEPQLRRECLLEIKKDMEEGRLNLDEYITRLCETKKGEEER